MIVKTPDGGGLGGALQDRRIVLDYALLDHSAAADRAHRPLDDGPSSRPNRADAAGAAVKAEGHHQHQDDCEDDDCGDHAGNPVP